MPFTRSASAHKLRDSKSKDNSGEIFNQVNIMLSKIVISNFKFYTSHYDILHIFQMLITFTIDFAPHDK